MSYADHVPNAIKNHKLVGDSTLHVVCTVSNPARFHSRFRLAREFIARMRETEAVKVHVVELALGDRHHEITSEETGGSLLQLRSPHELWSKEACINEGVKHLLPTDFSYMAWVDADIVFTQANWATETLHLLQSYPCVQPWTTCADMNVHGDAMNLFQSFCSMVQRGERIQQHAGQTYLRYGHSGYAWAATRTWWENTRGLIDFAILGSADHHQAWALINQVEHSIHDKMSDSFKRRCREWQDLAYGQTHGNLAAVPGMITHAWHGSKKARKYRERWQILIDNAFDPDKDLKREANGLPYVINKPHLVEEIRKYMRARNEDDLSE